MKLLLQKYNLFIIPKFGLLNSLTSKIRIVLGLHELPLTDFHDFNEFKELICMDCFIASVLRSIQGSI